MAALRPSGFNGTDSAPPLGDTVMRERQSSVTSETQYPVRSTGAAARGGGGGPGGGPNCAKAIAAEVTLKIVEQHRRIHHDARFIRIDILKNILPVLRKNGRIDYSQPRTPVSIQKVTRRHRVNIIFTIAICETTNAGDKIPTT